MLFIFHLPVFSRYFACTRQEVGTQTLEVPRENTSHSDSLYTVTRLEYTWKQINVTNVSHVILQACENMLNMIPAYQHVYIRIRSYIFTLKKLTNISIGVIYSIHLHENVMFLLNVM